MRITITEMAALTGEATAVIHSLDRSIYQVTVAVGGTDSLLVDDVGKPLRWRNLTSARKALSDMPLTRLVLRHVSAYDEMIGQPVRVEPNLLEVPLSQDY